MISNFFPCLKEVLLSEGGYVNDPLDPGGATNKGVTQFNYDEWRRDQKLPKQSVRAIGQEEIETIYKKLYWDTVCGDDLPAGVDYAVFDFGVNSSPHRAARYLQKALGVPDDGQIGPVTMARLSEFPACDLIDLICNKRIEYLHLLKTFDRFGRGWVNRVEHVREAAKDMADE
jgi:lysozyme family protein